MLEQGGQFDRAARVGETGLLEGREATDAPAALAAVRLVGGLLRVQLDDAARSFHFWKAAADALRPGAWKAECEIEAADLALSVLNQPGPAKTLLEAATNHLQTLDEPALTSQLQRVWGDWYARKGDRSSALAAYRRAMAARERHKSAVVQDAWRGAHSRSTEEFLRDRALDRARIELGRWQDEYPIDKVEGYLTFLQARYWFSRGRWPQAIALAGDLLAINPDSPYADRLVYLAAESEEKLGHADRARAGYQSLLKDYPGSPLVGEARKRLETPGRKPASAKGKP